MQKLNIFLDNFKNLSRHHSKLVNFLFPELAKINNANILEFGVSDAAMSTELFLKISEINSLNIYSVDTIDYSNKFSSNNWKFLQCRDDNYNKVNAFIPNDLSMILIDTIHEAEHVENILNLYYSKLSVNNCIFIDDISWLPYLKNSDKPRFYNEINNRETFEILLEIYYANQNNFDLEFTFEGTGMCKIKKKSSNALNKKLKIKNRKYSIKNILRKIFQIN